MPFLVPSAGKARLGLGCAHGDEKGSVRLKGTRCAHRGELGADTASPCPRCIPGKRPGTGARSLGCRSPRVLHVWPGHGLVLCPLHGATTTAANAGGLGVSGSDVSPACQCVPRGLHPVPASNEILSVLSSTAVLTPSPNLKPDNQSSLAMMVNLVNMNEWKIL